MTTSLRTKQLLTLLAALAAYGAFEIATLRAGHGWGDDFAGYISHARNIAVGADYADTGYIYNPHDPALGPAAYPPLVPMLLAPLYRWFGPDLIPMKAEMVIFLCLSFFFAFVAFRDTIPFPYLAAGLVVWASNPYFLSVTDSIGSDVPFLAFVFLSILLIDHAYAAAPAPRWPFMLGASLAMCAATGARAVGVVLLPSLLLYDLIRFRRPTPPALVAAAIVVTFVLAQRSAVPGLGSYADQLHEITANRLLEHAVDYLRSFVALWHGGRSKPLTLLLFLVASGLAVVGYLARLRRGPTFSEVFFFLYPIPILVWPSYQGVRFLMPIVPLYALYVAVGISELSARRRGLGAGVGASLLLAVALSYAARCATMESGPIREGVGKQESRELFAFVRENTGKDDVVVFLKPWVANLLMERSASVYHVAANDSELWDYLREIEARWVIVVLNDQAFPWAAPGRLEYLRGFVRRNRSCLATAYTNADFSVERITSLDACRGGSSTPPSAALTGARETRPP